MGVLVVLLCTVAGVVVLRTPVKKAAPVFYVLAAVLDILLIAGLQGVLPPALWAALAVPMRKCALAVSLFTTVMFIGVLPKGSKARGYLAPIRGELSIIACILTVGHIAAYAASYAPRLFGAGTINAFVLVGMGVAAVLVVLLAVLGITSLKSVKSHMVRASWMKIQKWAYVFFGLMYAHVLAMLLPSALSGGTVAIQTTAVYSALFVVYAVLRAVRWRLDAKAEGVASSKQASFSPVEANA